MIQITFHPLVTWPGEKTRHPERSRFRAGSYQSSLNLLDRELRHLKAKNVQIIVDVDSRYIRNDGWLHSNARLNTFHGVILSFESTYGPLQYPCDTFKFWQDNLRAIALALEHLRAVDRYGVTRRGEQYTGWAQLPAPAKAKEFMNVDQAAEWLAKILSGACPARDILDVKANFDLAYRQAAKKLHPDLGGDKDTFQVLQEVRDILQRHHDALAVSNG